MPCRRWRRGLCPCTSARPTSTSTSRTHGRSSSCATLRVRSPRSRPPRQRPSSTPAYSRVPIAVFADSASIGIGREAGAMPCRLESSGAIGQRPRAHVSATDEGPRWDAKPQPRARMCARTRTHACSHAHACVLARVRMCARTHVCAHAHAACIARAGVQAQQARCGRPRSASRCMCSCGVCLMRLLPAVLWAAALRFARACREPALPTWAHSRLRPTPA